MKKIIQLEEAFILLAGLAALYYLPVHLSWWLWLLLFFAPDLSMVGYLFNNKTGAVLYNLVHHRAIAVVVFFAGLFMNNVPLQLVGVLLFTHSTFDRMAGYGLKHFQSFHHTHLGQIGKFSRSEVAAE